MWLILYSLHVDVIQLTYVADVHLSTRTCDCIPRIYVSRTVVCFTNIIKKLKYISCVDNALEDCKCDHFYLFLLAGKVELHGKVIEVDYSVPKKLR